MNALEKLVKMPNKKFATPYNEKELKELNEKIAKMYKKMDTLKKD